MRTAFWAAGECMLELRPQAPGLLACAAAGDAFNTAVYLKRLAPRLTVRYLSALGDDAMSALVRAGMREHGIDDALTPTVPGGVAGLYAIATDPGGERRFSFWRAHSAARGMLWDAHLAQAGAMAHECRALLLTGISLAILDDARRAALLGLAERMRAAGAWVVLDNNYRAALWDPASARRWLDRASALCTHALFSQDDELAMRGEHDPAATLARLRALGVAEAVVKLGARGCRLIAEDGADLALPADPVDARDTTAAGDSFNAAYLAARLHGAGRAHAARAGCRLAAAVVQHPGAIIPADRMPAGTFPWR